MPGMVFKTDKVGHGYLPFYLREISGIQGPLRPVLVELGTAGGDSLQLWSDLMPTGSVIIGVDNGSLTQPIPVPGTRLLRADMTDPDLPQLIEEAIAEETGDPLDGHVELIVDDAGHIGDQTATAFANLWPLLVPGGCYVIEDWYVGGPNYNGFDDSMLRFVQGLICRVLEADTDTAALHYEYGLCAVRKRVL